MSKALKLLKILHNLDIFELQKIRFDHIKIHEAIIELEEAIKPKTCEYCNKSIKQKHNNIECSILFVNIYDREGCTKHFLNVGRDFCCNRYEPKYSA